MQLHSRIEWQLRVEVGPFVKIYIFIHFFLFRFFCVQGKLKEITILTYSRQVPL